MSLTVVAKASEHPRPPNGHPFVVNEPIARHWVNVVAPLSMCSPDRTQVEFTHRSPAGLPYIAVQP